MKTDLVDLPHMLFADPQGRIYDHPHYRMLGFSGDKAVVPKQEELVPLSEFSKLFFIPDCPPIGIDPDTGERITVSQMETGQKTAECCAVAAFLTPGWVRTHLPAADYSKKGYVLPTWAYSAVGFKDNQYVASAFMIEDNPKWDPQNYDDRDLIPAIESFQRKGASGRLAQHLMGCATRNHCFAAKNLFLRRWEAPLPVSQRCNAACIGCLSRQPHSSCHSSHDRIAFTPSRDEIVALAVDHLNQAPEPIVSFGQGCEGEPLTEYRLVADSIREIRRRTDRGTINLNTNGSWPDRIQEIARSGLDSIRISLNSARADIYRAYYRPKAYNLEAVVASISQARESGMYTMINYLVFPGITDTEEELEALRKLIARTGLNFVHLKNLCIDPDLYLGQMPHTGSKGMGMKEMVNRLVGEFPDLEFGYFNQAVR